MSKVSYKAQVYTMLKEAKGEPVAVSDFISKTGMTDYKLSAYIVNAKTDFGAVIVSVREGRKVVAYRMLDAGTGIKEVKTRGRKAKAVVAPQKVQQQVVVAEADQDPIENLRTSKVADIISDSVYEESPFEDQMFAEEFVRSL